MISVDSDFSSAIKTTNKQTSAQKSTSDFVKKTLAKPSSMSEQSIDFGQSFTKIAANVYPNSKVISNTSIKKKQSSQNIKAKPITKTRSFVYGAALLGVCGFAAKVMGAVFRIPLTYILGAEGMGLYQLVFPLYALMLTISSGGLPSALSRIISEKIALSKGNEARKILTTALISLIIFGSFCAGLLIVLHRVIANAQGNSGAALSYLGIAPSLIFVAVVSAYRGYFQGKQNMFPSAISQIIEQFIKMAAGLGLAYAFKSWGLQYAVLGAIIGVTLSEFAAMVVMIFQYYLDKDRLKLALPKKETAKYLKLIYAVSIPMTLSGIVMPLTQLIDSAIVINVLTAKEPVSIATKLYGLFSGTVNSLINMPVVLLLSISVALIPSVVVSLAKGYKKSAQTKSVLALKLTIILALPCFIVLFVLAQPVIEFLYGGGLKNDVINEPQIAAGLLMVSSVSVVFVSILAVSSSILQANGHHYIPVKNLLAGALVKILLNLILIKTIGIFGAAISSSVCYFVAMVGNIYALDKHIKIRLEIKNMLIKPLISTGLTGLCAYYTYSLCAYFINFRLALIIALALSAAVYAGLTAVLNILSEEDMARIPILKKMVKNVNISDF